MSGSLSRITTAFVKLLTIYSKIHDPTVSVKIKGDVTAYRIRVGDYRIVYDVYDDKKLVVILQIVRRSESTYK